MKHPKISVIVPIFNTAEYLQKCIYSIQNQSYKNLEIILVNDGSTDNSLDICNKFAKNDKRIIVIDKDNGGVSSARNAGLDTASGDYIGFVDSDDYISSEMFIQLIEASLENDADIVECGYSIINKEDNTIIPFPFKNEVINGNYECSKSFLTGRNSANINCNKLYRRKIFDDIRFPKYKYSEDFWVNAKAFYQCQRKVTIESCHYSYVKHKKNASDAPFNESMLDMIAAGKSVFAFYKVNFIELIPFVALYVVEHIVAIFRILKKSSTKKKEKYYLSILTNEFKYYYKLIDDEAFKYIKYTNRQIALILFSINPELYYLFYKIYQYLK